MARGMSSWVSWSMSWSRTLSLADVMAHPVRVLVAVGIWLRSSLVALQMACRIAYAEVWLRRRLAGSSTLRRIRGSVAGFFGGVFLLEVAGPWGSRETGGGGDSSPSRYEVVGASCPFGAGCRIRTRCQKTRHTLAEGQRQNSARQGWQ